MTYTFYNNSEGIYILYDSVSGAVIRSGELEAYICDALDPCGEKLSHLPEKCPSEIRYELARFSSTEEGRDILFNRYGGISLIAKPSQNGSAKVRVMGANIKIKRF